MEHTTARRRGLVALFAPFVAIAFVLSLTGCAGTPGATDELTDDLKKLLTVTDGASSCIKVVENARGKDAVMNNGVYKLEVEATTAAEKRFVTASPGLKLKGDTAKARHADIERTLCTDPLQGGEFAHWLATHGEIRGTTILSLNPWLEPFNINVDRVSVVVQETYLPNFGKTAPTDDEFRAQDEATRAYVDFASKLVTMLNRFKQYAESDKKSSLNYTLAAGGAVVGIIPPLKLNPKQESLKAKWYALTDKDQCEPLLVFGFNFFDKRVEERKPNGCEVTKKVVVKKVVKTFVTPPGKGGKCKPPSHKSGDKCVVKKTVVKGTTPPGGGGKSEDGAAKTPTPPKVGTGGGATAPPTAPTTPRDPPPSPQPGAGDDNGSVGTPP